MVVATATAAATAFGMVWLLVQGLAASGQSSACWERTGPGVAWNHSCPGQQPISLGTLRDEEKHLIS
ncbi:unnamed protein product [Arctogadus glacialis]